MTVKDSRTYLFWWKKIFLYIHKINKFWNTRDQDKFETNEFWNTRDQQLIEHNASLSLPALVSTSVNERNNQGECILKEIRPVRRVCY